MLGKSIYLSSNIEEINRTISSLLPGDICFTSLHCPEDFNSKFKEKADYIIDSCRKCGALVVGDISPKGLCALGFKNLIDAAKSSYVDAFRLDYGFKDEDILQASQYCRLVRNASMMHGESEIVPNPKFSKTIVMHNFYPRPETGLDVSYLSKCNDKLHDLGCEVWAFISGDDVLRGPLYEGLPTIEDYRYLPPYVQFVLLNKKLRCDKLFVGDVSISRKQENLIMSYIKDKILRIPIEINADQSKSICNKQFSIRHDSNSRVARIKESRQYASCGKIIEPVKTPLNRMPGSITVDNKRYLRYSGEIQIVKKDLPANDKVNVIAHILPAYLDLLELCLGDTKIMFISD